MKRLRTIIYIVSAAVARGEVLAAGSSSQENAILDSRDSWTAATPTTQRDDDANQDAARHRELANCGGDRPVVAPPEGRTFQYLVQICTNPTRYDIEDCPYTDSELRCWDTSNITDMSHTFSFSNATKIDFGFSGIWEGFPCQRAPKTRLGTLRGP